MSMMRSMRRAAVLGVWAAVAATAGCGDDGTASDNEDPVARIVADRMSVPAADGNQTIVTLDASSSTDADGDTLTYSWVVPNGQFENGTSATDAVIQVSFPGTAAYVVTVTVSDGNGGEDEESITIGLS